MTLYVYKDFMGRSAERPPRQSARIPPPRRVAKQPDGCFIRPLVLQFLPDLFDGNQLHLERFNDIVALHHQLNNVIR